MTGSPPRSAPRLHGEGVVLRPWREDDVLPPERDATSQRFLGDLVPTAAEFPDWLRERRTRTADGEGVFWCLADPGDDSVFGAIHVFRLGRPRRPAGRVGYWLLPAARGRGVLAEALDLVVAPAAEGGLGLDLLDADADTENLPSIARLREAGFAPVGVHRRALRDEFGAHDMLEVERHRDLPAPAWRLLRAPELAAAGRDAVCSPFTQEDLPVMAELLREPDGWPQGHPEAVDGDARAWWDELRAAHVLGYQTCWAIRVEGRPVGTVRAVTAGHPADTAEIGVWVRASHRRRGLARDAVALLVDHLLAPAGGGLTRVVATTSATNAASQALLRASGFAPCGAITSPGGETLHYACTTRPTATESSPRNAAREAN